MSRTAAIALRYPFASRRAIRQALHPLLFTLRHEADDILCLNPVTIMKLDESLLSAYLDDEIDPGQRRTVEQAIELDPSLRERLGCLARNHDLVAGLSRPSAPCSLAATLVTRIDHDQTAQRRRPYFWFATAASLLFALILLSIGSRHVAPVRQFDSRDVVRVSAPQKTTDSVDPKEPFQASVSPIAAKPLEPAVGLGPADDLVESSRHRLVSLLDRPGARRILIVTDVIDPAARDRVDSLLRDTGRKSSEFGRLTVAQGIVIDPLYPNEAEVFATVMDEREQTQFLARIADEFPTVIDEPEIDPTLGTQLAEVGSIRIEPGRTAAGLKEPPPGAGADSLAFRIADHSLLTHPAMLGGEPNDAYPSDLMEKAAMSSSDFAPIVPEQAPAAPRVKPRSSPKARKPDALVPVLVWVTSHQPARPRQ